MANAGVRTIPSGGLPVWAAPDPATQPTSRAAPGLEVRVLEYAAGWAKIAFHNGWVGWVDARALASSKPALTPLPAIGAALIVLGGFLPWVTAGGESGSAWDLPVMTLFDKFSTSQDPKTGLVLLVVLVAGVPYLTKKPFPPAVNLALAGIGAGAGLLAFRLINELQVVDPGMGLVVTLVGAFVLGAEFFVVRSRAR
jgi:hypothetical protein